MWSWGTLYKARSTAELWATEALVVAPGLYRLFFLNNSKDQVDEVEMDTKEQYVVKTFAEDGDLEIAWKDLEMVLAESEYLQIT